MLRFLKMNTKATSLLVTGARVLPLEGSPGPVTAQFIPGIYPEDGYPTEIYVHFYFSLPYFPFLFFCYVVL